MHPFEVMAEPVRRRIIDILASGEHTAGNVAEVVSHEFGITQSAVSKHLRVLRETSFVEVRPEESARYYSLSEQAIKQLVREVKRLRRLWRNRIALYAPADNILRAGIPRHRGVRPPGYTVDASGRSRRGLRGRSPGGVSRAADRWQYNGTLPDGANSAP